MCSPLISSPFMCGKWLCAALATVSSLMFYVCLDRECEIRLQGSALRSIYTLQSACVCVCVCVCVSVCECVSVCVCVCMKPMILVVCVCMRECVCVYESHDPGGVCVYACVCVCVWVCVCMKCLLRRV